MAKRKKSKSKKSSNILKHTVWILAFIAVILSSFIAGYYIGKNKAEQELTKKYELKDQKRLAMLKKVKEEQKENVSSRLKQEIIIENKRNLKNIGASHEYEGSTLPQLPKREDVINVTKPKLAIIIDDVSIKSQVKAIKDLNLPITMSFLPPSKFSPNSSKLAAKENFYMVHLPMEAKNFSKEEPFTLRASDSQEKITQRIANIKQLFPKVKYINNHAGSKFTSSETAVKRLVYALKEQNINFIDSRTIASTKVPIVMKKLGNKYMARDVFLDHEMDKGYIKEQIKKAIKIAKKHGTAIAIGHPHINTLLAISESKKLFKEVDLVMVNRLY